MTDANTKLARQCVRRGAAFLDKEDPKWFRCIDLAKFNIWGDSCVIGQVYLEGFSDALVLLGISYDTPRLGFVSGYEEEGVYADYHSLQMEWDRLIRKRQLANGGLRVS